MRRVGPILGIFCAAVVLTTACSTAPTRSLNHGDLSTFARRVVGGGAECPLRFDRELLRPTNVSPKAVISPLRVQGSGSMAVVGADKPDSGLGRRRGIQINCWYRIGDMRVDMAVVSVRDGKAVAQLALRLEQHSRSSSAEMATFIAVNADVATGDAKAVPGTGQVAYVRIPSGDSDVGMLISYSPIEDKGTPPDDAEMVKIANALAKDLVE